MGKLSGRVRFLGRKFGDLKATTVQRIASSIMRWDSPCHRCLQKISTSSHILWCWFVVCVSLATLPQLSHAADPSKPSVGNSSKASREDAKRRIPFNRMSSAARESVQKVVDHPTYFRRMPNQVIDCDPDMFTFLVRRPEVMVNIWDIMGITKVKAQRVDPYSFLANDGVGTICRCELVYATKDVHVYMGNGSYDGSMTPRKVTGRCVCVLRSRELPGADGTTKITGTMDVFLKLDNFGADLLARSVAPFVGKTADYNFVETAAFISQISAVCERSPATAQSLAIQLQQIQPEVRGEFSRIAANIAMRGASEQTYARRTPQRSEYDRPRTSVPSPSPTGVRPAPAATMRLSDSPAPSYPAAQQVQPTPNATAKASQPSPWSNLKTSLVRRAPTTEFPQVVSAPPAAQAPVEPLNAPAYIAPRKQKIYMRR